MKGTGLKLNSKKIALLVVIVAVLSTLAIGVAYAGTANSILVYTSYVQNPSSMTQLTPQFALGQTVYIGWFTGNGGTVDISVTGPNGPVALTLPAGYSTPTNLPTTESFQVYFTPTTVGQYTVTVNGAPLVVNVSTLFVLPEYAWGALGMLVAGFGAFACFGFVKNNRAKRMK